MKARLNLPALIALVSAPLVLPATASAQFNPEGRKRHAPTGTAKPKPDGSKTDPSSSKPEPASKSAAPNLEALIARYQRVVLEQPGSQFPVQRLAQLYRERDGKLDLVISEFERLANQPGPEQWNALCGLAGLYKQDGQYEKAVQTYEKAIAQQPDNPSALVALALLASDRGDKAGARKSFERALPKIKNAAEREQTLRTLMGLALDLKDFESGQKYHRELVKNAGGSFFVRAELGRELLQRGEYTRAATEYEAVVKAAAGDNRALAPALRDLGRSLARAGKREEALGNLRRALRIAGDQAGVVQEVLEIIADIYRGENRLRELVAELEREKSADPTRLKLLAQLYEETGDLENAMKTHRKALLKNPKDVGVRVKLVQLLQVQGDLDKAIKEDEALIQAAPQNPDFVFQLAEALIQRGDRKAALEQLSRLEARMGNDQDSLPVLVDFYERIGEKERARHLLERLAGSDLRDPRHLVELGSRYWEAGDKKKAQATWQRIRLVGSDRVQALIALGDVYLDHDLMREALEVYREVMKLAPKELRPIRAYALALERTVTTAPNRESRLRQYEEARRIWEQLLRSFASDKNLAREARQHMVTLWSLSGQLEQHVFPLERQLKANPPGLEAGRLLAEVQMRLQKYADAQATLERVTELAPGDAQSLQRLEQALVQQKKLRGAIEVLKKLLLVEPNLARRYYERMAKYASELYQDDEAIQYAARAVELGPDDAEAHKKLGEMYQQRQQIDQAIAAFRAALSKNDRLFSAYFELAELLLSQGKDEEADKLLRRVVRSAPDEDLVAQAARLSSQINLSRGTLDVLERDLFSVALGNPQKPLYRRLLVEIYGALAFPLVHQAKLSDPKLAEAARAELKKLGERAVKPLLDALGDSRDSQQRVAIELLGHIQNKGAGPALFAFATGPGEQELRVRAMIAVGELRDPALLPKFAGILDAREARLDESDPVIVAAVWSVARMRSPKAARLLKILLSSESPDISALAALGLGLLGDKLAGPRLSSTMRSSDAGPLPRAAAAFALGELGMKSETGMLGELVESRDPTLQVTVLIALSRLGVPAVRHEIADAFMIPEPSVQRAAVSAAMIMATGAYRAPRDPLALSASDTKIDVRALIEELCPVDYTPDERALAFSELSSELSRAAVASVQSSAERASAVMDTLMAGGTRVGFGPLLLDLDRVKPEFADKARRGAEAIAASVVEPVVALMNHPSAEVRTRVVQFLATRSENIAKRALIQALRDPDERVERAAIEGAEHRGGSEAMEAIAGLLKSSGSWPVRLRAASALGNGDAAARPAPVLDALSRAARTDTHALVREAAVIALNRLDRQVALPVLRAMAQSDPEVRLRQLALALSEGAKPPR